MKVLLIVGGSRRVPLRQRRLESFLLKVTIWLVINTVMTAPGQGRPG